MAAVHPSAIVAPSARLAEGVTVGPYAVIGDEVEMGEGTKVHSHAVVTGPACFGRNNVIHPFAALGGEAQHRRATSHALVVGDGNVFREHVTVHRGTEATATTLGDDNLFMCGAHVGHDASIGRNVVVANGVQLAGHVRIADHVVFGGLAGVAQFVRIGEGAFVAAGAMVERDVGPFLVVQGDRARVRGINRVGLTRRGVSADSIARLEQAYRRLYGGEAPFAVALRELAESELARDAFVSRLAGELLASLAR